MTIPIAPKNNAKRYYNTLLKTASYSLFVPYQLPQNSLFTSTRTIHSNYRPSAAIDLTFYHFDKITWRKHSS